MQTCCPNCNTKFRLTEAQLELAEGLVRCGVCQHVFNVYQVSDESEDASQADTHAVDDQLTTNAENSERASESYSDQPDHEHDDVQNASPQTDDISHAATTPAETLEDGIQEDDTLEDGVLEDSVLEDSLLEDDIREDEIRADSALTNESSEDDILIDISDGVVSDEAILDEHPSERFAAHDDDSRNDSEHYNFFDDSEEHSSGHVVPEELRESHADNSHSTLSTALWGFGILFLTATLFIEYIWFNRDQFTAIPEIQARIDELCQQFDCNDLSLRVPSRIELVTRNIYSHPNEKDVLLVDVTMKNKAAFSQPYPVLKIDFSDIRGGIVASRAFLPREYLDSDHSASDTQSARLAPDATSSITLEILDPGIQAMTYEFDFL